MFNLLYVDNFRGFKNAYIPIKDVNFLVGENSTGKTSILALISLLGSLDFWFDQEFNTDVFRLGRFKDIVSIQAENRRQFRIGYIFVNKDNGVKQYDDFEAVLMTFTEKDNNPLISQYNYLNSQGQVKIIFSRGDIYYKYTKDTEVSKNSEYVLKIFEDWAAEELSDNKEFRTLRKVSYYERRRSLAFIDDLLREIFSEQAIIKDKQRFTVKYPMFDMNIAWLAPIRSKPKRTYDEYKLEFNPEGEHTPYLIRHLLRKRKASNDFLKFIEKFGNESGLFESIDIKGYGREVASPFELTIVMNNIYLAVVNVGYGVSQALPVIVEMFARTKGTQFLIQQPEIHLHPKAQAALGDVVYKLATEDNKRFFIETHSDYIIDRFRLNYRMNQGKTKIRSQILFFGRNLEGNYVVPIDILENGEYTEEQPKAFREFFIHEEMRILGI